MPSVEWNRIFGREVKQDDTGVYGNRWGNPEGPRLKAIRGRFLHPFVSPEKTAMEIGSGGGRFTQYLLPFKKVYCVDINPEMFDYLKRRFPDATNLEFIESSGHTVPGVPPHSVDFVWSFGTFVHIEEPEMRGYLKSLKPTLRPGARLTLHYTDKTKPEAKRQSVLAMMTQERMHDLLRAEGYAIIEEDAETLHHSNVVAFALAS